MKIRAPNPLRPRNAIGLALVLGILAGIWLGDLFQGFGLGPGSGSESQGPSDESRKPEGQESRGESQESEKKSGSTLAVDSRRSTLDSPVRVVIDGRSYFVRQDDGLREITLPELIELVERTPPSEDGLKIFVDATRNSRAAAEVNLSRALDEAGIPRSAIHMPIMAGE
jgi:hypothetical protein